MKIRTQLLLSAVVFAAVLVVIAASVISTTAELGRLDGQAELAEHISLAANDLNYLASEYLLYGEPQQLERWEARHAQLAADLANLSAGGPDRQALIAAMGEDRERLESVFDDIVAQAAGAGAPADPASMRVSWSRIGIQTQALVFDAARLSTLLEEEADRARFVNTLLVSALLAAFAVLLLTSYLVVGRRTLRSLSTVLEGTEVIGSGDLEHEIEATGDDEVSELSRAFNRMTADLRTVTASRAELERAEQAVREREQILQSILRAAPVGIGTDSHRTIRSVNEHFCLMTGYAADELIGRDVRFLYFSDEAYEYAGKEKYAQMLQDGISAVETQLRRKDGMPIDILLSASPMDRAKPYENVVFIALDISDLREKGRALRESEAKYRNLVELSPDAILIHVDGAIVFANPAAAALVGAGLPDDLVGRPVLEIVHPGAQERVKANIEADLRGEESPATLMDLLRDDGTTVPVHGRGALIPFGGRPAVQVVLRDVSEEQRAETALREYAANLQRSNEDLERFAYVSSHDLQEPLRAIVSFSQLLERRYRGQLGQDADEYIEFIVEGGLRMQSLIQDLLAYSRVNSTKQTITQTDITDVLTTVERHLGLQLREAGATIAYGTMPVVMADPLQLEQVFTNLVSNAIKFRSPDRAPEIRISAERLDGFWEFAVSDNGIGIEPEYFEKIFVIFQRLHTRETYPGTGIGLAIVKRIIDRHGGTIRVESTPGEGSTFFFTLPAA